MLRLSKSSLDWALDQALYYGDTDIFPSLFEFKAIQVFREELLGWLANEDVRTWRVRPFRRCLTPKHRYGFRVSTQLDPLDFLVFTALVYEIGQDLEVRRVKVDEGIVHSYRFAPADDGRMYSNTCGYETFRQRCAELASGPVHWVVVADIADFFPRLYTHRIDNALRQATERENHCRSIGQLIHGWNNAYSYGIPVGSAASRLIAEISLDDVDRSLMAEGVVYVRYSDDFRIFCGSQREAYERLSLLANVLFENHGLTLQQHKTRILPLEEFRRKYLATETSTEIGTLSARFRHIAKGLGLADCYNGIQWDDLTPEQQSSISQLNLQGILEEQSKKDEIDIPLTKFVLRRLTQTGDASAVHTVLSNVDSLYPVFPDAIRYLQGLRGLPIAYRQEVGSELLDILSGSIVGHLEYHRMWLLNAFSTGDSWGQEKRLAPLFARWGDHFTRREVMLGLAHSCQDNWFRTKKRHLPELPPWERRALLAAGGCLPADERKHWFNSLDKQLDPLEQVVMKHARSTAI